MLTANVMGAYFALVFQRKVKKGSNVAFSACVSAVFVKVTLVINTSFILCTAYVCVRDLPFPDSLFYTPH